MEADFGLNSTDQVGFILIDSNSCLGDTRFGLKTIGQSKDSFIPLKIGTKEFISWAKLKKTETFWYEALYENFKDGARHQAVQFRSNSSEPIVLVLEFSSYGYFNFTEVSFCIFSIDKMILRFHLASMMSKWEYLMMAKSLIQWIILLVLLE